MSVDKRKGACADRGIKLGVSFYGIVIIILITGFVSAAAVIAVNFYFSTRQFHKNNPTKEKTESATAVSRGEGSGEQD